MCNFVNHSGKLCPVPAMPHSAGKRRYRNTLYIRVCYKMCNLVNLSVDPRKGLGSDSDMCTGTRQLGNRTKPGY